MAANMLWDSTDVKLPPNLIREVFSDELLRALAYHALRVDIPDNNDKAEMIRMMVPDDFDELGTGTNRIAFLHGGLVYKIGMDRRGYVDNYTEFKRSQELPMYLAKTYETNLLINVCEYVTVIDQSEFMKNEDPIKQILTELSKGYLFDDIGYTLKNYCNWGYRNCPDGTSDLVILDYGYLYPLIGQDLNVLFRCPRCGGLMKWDPSFTKFVCTNSKSHCTATATPNQMRHMMKLDFESMENQIITALNSSGMPNLAMLEQSIKMGDVD